MNRKQKTLFSKFTMQVLLLLGAVSMMTPFVWMILTAFKTPSEATSVNPFVLWPSSFRRDAFQQATQSIDFMRTYLNTLLLIFWRVVSAVATATMAGYALARLNFRGKSVFFGLVLFQMMVPSQLFVLPQYLMISKMGMQNTIFALVFPGLVTAFGTFLLRQTYLTLPKELEEASRIDGCHIGQTFLYVMMPLTRASMVALGIFTALFAYKELMWPLIVNTDKNYLTLSSALAKIQGQYAPNYPELMAASLLACIPMLIIYLLFQRQFVEGIATTGGKL